MSPEAGQLLAKAKLSLGTARHDLDGGYAEAAARGAYIALFHAAQALPFEKEGKLPKTHSGLRARLGQLAKSDTRIGDARSTLLAKAYAYKEIADYALDRSVEPTAIPALIAQADEFVSAMEVIIVSQES